MVDVVVELLERRHEFRPFAHLRADRDELAREDSPFVSL
jgi:hypothetical protein